MARLTFAAASLGVLLAGSGCVQIGASGPLRYMASEEKRFTTTGRPMVVLSTFDGPIDVRPWDRPEVLVVVEKYAITRSMTDDIEIRTDQNGDRVTVEARIKQPDPSQGLWTSGRSARLVVSVPASSDVQARSGDGSIAVEHISGQFDLESGDGSIRGRDLTGNIRAHTGDGSIRLEGVNGAVDIDTRDGSIVANGTLTALRARSGDGSVRVHADRGSAAKDDWDISTGDGSVIVELPDAFDAELDANTGDGRVSVHRSIMSDQQDQSRRKVRGRLGAGGNALRVRSGDGSITLR
jgi:Putative adhesin